LTPVNICYYFAFYAAIQCCIYTDLNGSEYGFDWHWKFSTVLVHEQ